LQAFFIKKLNYYENTYNSFDIEAFYGLSSTVWRLPAIYLMRLVGVLWVISIKNKAA